MPTSPIRSKLRTPYCSPQETAWKNHLKEHSCSYDTNTNDPAMMERSNPFTGPSTGAVYQINKINHAQPLYKWQDVSCNTRQGLISFLTAYDASVNHGGFTIQDYDVNEAIRAQWEINFHKNNALVDHVRALGIAFNPNVDFDASIGRGVIACIYRFWYQGP